ncbi:MAG: FMN-binding negative transcriptional regulator [Ignavibacteriae bacterium]|nr:FMN-binding negative transcriptional regulator [Ignavibacteriota bacterium]
MYIPKHNLIADREEIVSYIRTYPFGTIISSKDNYPIATHLPFVLSEIDGKIIITSHFAKANEQWRQISDSDVLIIFSEHNAYISPKFYDSKMEVPTWNYIAVHAYGKGKILIDENQAFEVLEKMIDRFDKEYKAQWDNLPSKFKNSLVKEIVAFEIAVTDIQGKKKISQNKKRVERSRIISAFDVSEDSNEREIGEFMKRNEK